MQLISLLNIFLYPCKRRQKMFHFHKGLSLSPLTTASPTNPFLLIYGLQCRNSSSHRFVIIISIVVIDIIIAFVIFPLDKIPPDKIFGCVKFNTWSPPDSHHWIWSWWVVNLLVLWQDKKNLHNLGQLGFVRFITDPDCFSDSVIIIIILSYIGEGQRCLP